jgi:hypothetical protein
VKLKIERVNGGSGEWENINGEQQAVRNEIN